MNIIWILTDGICNYERPGDSFGLTPTFLDLRANNEGFYFENAFTSFGSTVFSLFSIFTGKFPYYIFPDYYPSAKFIPGFENNHQVHYLKEREYNINAIMHWQEGCRLYKDILNPYYKDGIFDGDRMIEAKEMYEIFLDNLPKLRDTENNFLYVHFRPADPQMDVYLKKTIETLKKEHYWENSIIIISSDHGYTDNWKWYKRMNLLHFDDIMHSTLSAVLFMKFPESISSALPRNIKERVYLLDIMETVLDYLDISPTHNRDSLSFKPLIEGDIDINKERIVRADCYLMFQPKKKTSIIKNNWQLYIENDHQILIDLAEHKLEYIEKKGLFLKIPRNTDFKKTYPAIYTELLAFHTHTEKVASEEHQKYVEFLYNQSFLKDLDKKTIFIPSQFPPQLVKALKIFLKQNNHIIEDYLTLKRNSSNQKVITLLIFNRLTGYGIKKLMKRYRGITDEFLIVDTKLEDAKTKINKLGYWKFVKRTYKARDRQIFQRWREILTFIFYFPAYLNKSLKKYYKKGYSIN